MMATKKKSKRVQSSSATSAKMRRKVQIGVRSYAAMEAQIAALEKQIAALASGAAPASDSGLQASGKTHKHIPEARSPKPEARPEAPRGTALPPPVFTVTVIGRDRVEVRWEHDERASSYQVEWSTDADFMGYASVIMVNASLPSVSFSGLMPDTTYYFRMTAMGKGEWYNSEPSATVTAKTWAVPTTDGNTAEHLLSWFEYLQAQSQNASTLVPEIGNTVLTMSERRRLLGSGVRRYGFIDKVSDTAVVWPQFWPDYVGDGEKERLKILLREIEALRNLLVFFESGAREMQDLLLIRGNEAFRIAGKYYGTVRDAARRQVPDAEALFRLLREFWRRRRSMSAEPTKKEVMRDVRGLMNGTREGEMLIENESDSFTKGKRTVVDNTRKKPRNNFKEVETGKVDLSSDSTDECR